MPRWAAFVAVVTLAGLCGSVRAANELLTQAVEQIAVGRWDAALEVLQSDQDRTDPQLRQLRGLLREHMALQQQRHDQRLAVVDEKRQAFESLDLQQAEESTLIEAIGLFKAAWDNAIDPQREDLRAMPQYATLLEAVDKHLADEVQAGRWDAAWSKWMRWLIVVEPQRYRNAADDLRQRRAIVNAIRVNPCDEAAVPYERVKRDTAVKVFNIIDARYAEPVPYDRIVEHGLGRLKLLPVVLANPTVSFAVEANGDGFAEWTTHLEKLASADVPKNAADMAGLIDTLLAVNATTLTLPDGVIIAQFTEAALAALDPYTEAVWPEGVGLFEKNLTGQFGGVGIRIRKDGQNLVIVSVIPDTPAAQTILAADDVILEVDGRSTLEMPTDCAVQLISGPIGTSVSLTVRPAGVDKNEVVTVMRQKIVLPTVEGAQRADNNHSQGHWDYFLDVKDRIGYLLLNGFTDKTTHQAKRVLEELEQRQLRGLIVDMRGNGGGLLSEATAFANLFIGDGILLSSRGRGDNTVWKAKPNEVRRDYPIVMLVDEGSASASEIVAGAAAVRRPGQVTLIGQRTYGKGSVQEVADLGQTGGRLKFTSAYYYLPDGNPVPNRYQREAENRTDWGIAPAIELPLFAYEQDQIRKIQLERRKQLMSETSPAAADLHSESLTQQMLMADAQLSAAVVLLKAQLLAAQ